jgi:hypothetical protein
MTPVQHRLRTTARCAHTDLEAPAIDGAMARHRQIPRSSQEEINGGDARRALAGSIFRVGEAHFVQASIRTAVRCAGEGGPSPKRSSIVDSDNVVRFPGRKARDHA